MLNLKELERKLDSFYLMKSKSLINNKSKIDMKKFKISTVTAIAVYAMLAAVFTSCNDLNKSFDNSRCMETVEKAYPKAKVYPLPDKEYRYIVIDTCGKVMYVRVLGKWDEISSINVIQDCR